MRKLPLLILTVVVFAVSCTNNQKFEIAKNQLGEITSKTTIAQIDKIFAKDSIVKQLSEGVLGYQGTYTQDDDHYLIYNKEGKHLLTITPKEPLDSLSTIRCIDIFDENFKTKEGVGLSSTFEEINLLTHIGKIEATFTKATLFLDQINATMTLDKEDLGIKSYSTEEIKKEQIPGLTKPKTFVLWFE